MKLKKAEESQFRKAIRILRDGGLVIAPTETFYGIIADARSSKAVKRLVRLKGRNEGKPVPLIVGDTITASKAAAAIPSIFKPLAEEFWPGPLTLVLKSAKGFPNGITAGTGSIGIRVPSRSPALDIARLYKKPLTATSANFSGQPPPRSVKELDPELVDTVDLVIDGGTTPGGQPSTVLDITVDPPAVIRPGVLGEEVEGFLRESVLDAGTRGRGDAEKKRNGD